MKSHKTRFEVIPVTEVPRKVPDIDCCDAQCLSYIAGRVVHLGLGMSPRSVSSHRVSAARPSVD
jgi:hypothetical protein